MHTALISNVRITWWVIPPILLIMLTIFSRAVDSLQGDLFTFLYFYQNWEVLNTAVLTGRQVSQAMKVLIVSQAGQVADVTLQSSCHSEDESVLKVRGEDVSGL